MDPLSATLSSFAGEGPDPTLQRKLKSKHPNIFRQDGLQLRGFPDATTNGFYYRLRLDNPKEQPPIRKDLFEGDIKFWYKKDDKHFVVRSTKRFPHSDGNWGLVQVAPQGSYQPGYKRSYTWNGFVSQQDAEIFRSHVRMTGGVRDTDVLRAQLEAQSHRAAINPLSLGAHPPKTTLVLTKHDIDRWRFGQLVVSEEIKLSVIS